MRDDDHLRKVCEVVITNCGGSVCLYDTLAFRSTFSSIQKVLWNRNGRKVQRIWFE